jgi:hypothetical protein
VEALSEIHPKIHLGDYSAAVRPDKILSQG